VLLHFQTAHVPRPNVYCTAVSGLVQGTAVGVSAMGQWQGLVPALGPCDRCGPSPESLVSSAAKRFDTTSGDVDVSGHFAVLLALPG
jgi:hypothetical protein